MRSEYNAWEAVKQHLQGRLTSEAFHNWLARTELESMDGNRLRVNVPDEVSKIWLESEYAPRIQEAVRAVGLEVAAIEYQIKFAAIIPPTPEPHPHSSDQQPYTQFTSAVGSAPHLNPRFRFDTFVVGSCNQFAHAASFAVATSPTKSYNPLFIYGGSGMGKTHLMHAIGRELMETRAAMRVVYTSGERFMNEMIQSIRTDRMASFQQHYRTADALLIDDIHILAGKERTQEEFFHTFNELYDHQKQIVISSDQLPKNTPGLVERLRSRFEWGLMVDVQPPDLETKMAILDKKAEAEGVTLPENVRVFLATKTKSSIRELEGAFTKLLAYSSVTKAPISLPMAQQALRQMLPNHERRVTIDMIIKAV
ncbi:MAG: chromosomal replication initiator protein DnaA, partial [Acidobacteria bacterium]|nr:chromosomal replication initiator protein DnaA [Acidobacteriota bacterium]